MGIFGKIYYSKISGSMPPTQRTLPGAIVKWILVLTSLSLSAVSCGTVTVSSGFERQTLRNGDNITLQCRATGLYHVTITWLLDGLPLEYTSPEPTGSVRLKADNPHTKPNFLTSEKSRYLIKNSNERPTEDKRTSDVTAADVTEGESRAEFEEVSNSTRAVSRETTARTPAVPPSSSKLFEEPAPIVLPDIALNEDGIVTVTSVLALKNATVDDGGIYSCVAIDIVRDSARWSEKIAVAGPLSLRQNRPMFSLINSVVVIPCTVLGTGNDLPVQWFYRSFPNAVEDASTLGLTLLPDDHRQTVHSNGSLEIREARKANEGVYTCRVDLEGTLANMSTPLKVMVPPKIKSFALPQVQVGKPIAEFCVVSEGDTPLDITWYKNGILLRPNNFLEIHRSGKRALSFTISSVDPSSAGNYSCCAANNVSRTCQTSELVVLDPPKILDLPPAVSAISGTDVDVPCRVTGFPKPNVTWMRVLDDSQHVYSAVPKMKAIAGQAKRPKLSQADNGSLIVANVSSADGGKYLCRATNEVDELSRFVTLRVHNPARVVELAGTRNVVYRSDVTIDCASWGDGEVEIAWLKDGKALPFSDRLVATALSDDRSAGLRHPIALNRLTIKNTIRSDTGSYACRATNNYGSSTKTIDVVVRAPPSKPISFKVIDKGTSFLRVVVAPGEDDGGSRLLSYELNFTKVSVEESSPLPPDGRVLSPSSRDERNRNTETVMYPASTSSPNQEVTLDRLECGSEYNVSIRATNEIGRSFEALNLKARTMGTDPVVPTENELIVEVNQTAVVLDLRAWQNGGCPITDLTVEFARHGDIKWNVTSIDTSILRKELSQTDNGEKSGKNPGHLVISSLKPGTWYKIWSSACNNAGCNYVTHSVPTLLPSGATVPPLNIEVEKEAAESTDVRFLVPMVCGFGLVLLLVLLLVFYRYKQRSKKQKRLKEARTMAKELMYKTEDDSSHSVGMRVELPERRSAADEVDEEGVALVETSLSSADGDEAPAQGADRDESSATAAPLLEDASHQHFDTLAILLTEGDLSPHTPLAKSNVHGSVSGNSKKSETKISLKDNAELAVFREAASSDDEDRATNQSICDESAFGDSGTWCYFQPGSQAAARPKKRSAGPAAAKKPAPRRPSSSSSGTDEELAQVFGLPCSKQKFKPVAEKELFLQCDFNENCRPASLGKPPGMNCPSTASKMVVREARINLKNDDHRRNLAGDHERANSTGMVLSANDQRHFKPLPGGVSHPDRRPDYPAPQRRALAGNLNPFKAAFRPAGHQPPPLVNFHRPDRHVRGHTYSYDTPQHHWNRHFATKPSQFGSPSNASPYGERQWVNTYDSQYGTTRSKPPSWGSTDLDKAGLCMPSAPASHRGSGGDASPKYHTADVAGPCQPRDSRKLDTNSPRDSGIGSDEGPGTRHSASSISPPHVKGRNVQKSLESLDEVEPLKRDHHFGICNGVVGGSSGGKDSIFPPSPPLSPTVSETKLTPHVFVDISSKCNTTPTRTSRSSYPPYRQPPTPSYFQSKHPKKLEYYPTPPTSPEDAVFPRARGRRANERWGEASLDRLATYHRKSDSGLLDGERVPVVKSVKPQDGDTMYSMTNNDCTWPASTLV